MGHVTNFKELTFIMFLIFFSHEKEQKNIVDENFHSFVAASVKRKRKCHQGGVVRLSPILPNNAIFSAARLA